MTDDKTYSYELMKADCFKLLAACFYQPEKVLFQEENVLDNLVEMLHEICSEAQGHAQRMKTYFEKTDGQELAIEYATLFVGPFELKAPPYGSIYLEGSHQVMGQSTIETMNLYRAAGLKLDIKEPADHVAIELEFVNYLILAEVDARASGDDELYRSMSNIRRAFFSQFLGKWVPEFCDAVIKVTEEGYYHSLAECLLVFITREKKTTDQLNYQLATKQMSASV